MQTSALSPLVISTFEEAAAVLKPPPKLTVSQWAEANRVLSSETSSYRGLYRCSLAPYQKAMMDAVNIPGVEEVVYWTGAQLGKSTVQENIFGYFADQDACPILWMWPTLEVAKAWSNDTLDPLLRDSPCLAAKFVIGSRKSSNRTLVKRFPGGILSIIGANSAAELRRRKARVIIGDELDGWKATEEGDSLAIVSERSVTFWDAIRVLASTCTIKGESAIEAAYEVTNRQKYYVKCLHCGEQQLIRWKDIIAPRGEEPTAENTHWCCPFCGACHSEAEKLKILALGEWIAERPEIVKRQGFWLPSYYSPFEPWYKQVAQFRDVVARREDSTKLMAFTNLKLAETWEERAIKIDAEGLLERCEKEWPSPQFHAPAGVCIITAGVDVQPDRIEVEVVGHGRHFESWSLDVKVFDGPINKPEVWQKLDEYLDTKFVHERGVILSIAVTFVDCGYNQGEVMNFTKTRWRRRIWASKGMNTFTAVPLGKRNQNNKQKVWMYPVGVSSIKKTIYQRLALETPGSGYLHFSAAHNDAEYFDQLTCEKLVPKNVNGRVVYEWKKPEGKRNEALDRRVYATAALLSLWEAIPVEKGLDREYARILEEAKKLAESKKHNPNQLSLLVDVKTIAEVVSESTPEQASAEAEPNEVAAASDMPAADPAPSQAPVPESESTPPTQPTQPDAPKSMRRRLLIKRRW